MTKQPRCRAIYWRTFVISFLTAFPLSCATTGGLCQQEFTPSSVQSQKGSMISGVDASKMYCKYEVDGPTAYQKHVEKTIEYAPPSGRGPIVILLSGVIGTFAYRRYSASVARLGYYVILLNGHTVSLLRYGEDDMRKAIEQAQRSPKALPGKAAVIGFSLGGGAALTHASRMPDFVSAVVAYYPVTIHIQDMGSFAARFQVPTFVLSGEKDTYLNCCLIESMRAMEAAAMEVGAPFELVTYPNVTHIFNLKIYKDGVYKAETTDAWQRTTKMLGNYHPLGREVS